MLNANIAGHILLKMTVKGLKILEITMNYNREMYPLHIQQKYIFKVIPITIITHISYQT